MYECKPLAKGEPPESLAKFDWVYEKGVGANARWGPLETASHVIVVTFETLVYVYTVPYDMAGTHKTRVAP